ncbi:hypothetical protein SLEP1_g28478 [Rubroshorea leprosula]|uniref:BHLH domain-containing protein n=1 Tax=Rubroshorea leprosula TaxID=152421 RepID=A0AAV5JTY5_9ROSI|nr:hypothetical protein SLEP1_g28478 [Rubroshorea leprosula]
MEKEVFMNEGTQLTWNSCTFGMEIQANDLNSATGQVPSYFLNPNWENSMDHSDPFESALSSMGSSPAASNAAGSSDNVREVITRLGNLRSSSGEISPNYCVKSKSTSNSGYSTPLSSPRMLNLSMVDSQIRGNLALLGNELTNLAPLSVDPGFVERATRFSCFGSTELPQRLVPTPRMESGMLSRVTSNQSIKVAGSHQSNKNSPQNGNSGRLENAEIGDSKEECSVSEQIPGGGSITKSNNGTNARKRKSTPRGKAKETPYPSASDAKVAAENDESTAKRNKQDEAAASGNAKENDENQKQAKENPKPPEPPKDYIHVRARRGQATDSHSLAERVRRERISERMKFLQDLVPGCNKVIGKAVMLDEIINYVQSLQRQVEFLSMKLATVNPRMDFNMEALLSKDIFQSPGSLPHTIYPVDSSAPAFPFGYQPQQGLSLQGGIPNNMERQFSLNLLNPSAPRNSSMQFTSMDGFCDTAPLVPSFWEDDLQGVVQMGFGQNQPQNFHGSMTAGQVKIEL